MVEVRDYHRNKFQKACKGGGRTRHIYKPGFSLTHHFAGIFYFTMSKTLKVTFGVSLLMGENWQKIDIEEQPEKGDTMESILDDVSKRLRIWHEKKYPEFYNNGKKQLVILDTENGVTVFEDKEWSEIKSNLDAIEFQEDAQQYINTTNYSMTVEAKKLINQKPLKNKQ